MLIRKYRARRFFQVSIFGSHFCQLRCDSRPTGGATMTQLVESQPESSKSSLWRRHLKTAPSAPSQIERFADPGAVSSRRAYGRSIYHASQVNVLLARYVRIRGDMLMAWPEVRQNGTDSAREAAIVCANLLKEAR